MPEAFQGTGPSTDGGKYRLNWRLHRFRWTTEADLDRNPTDCPPVEMRLLEITAWLYAHWSRVQARNADKEEARVPGNCQTLLWWVLNRSSSWTSRWRLRCERRRGREQRRHIDVLVWEEEFQINKDRCPANTARSGGVSMRANVEYADTNIIYLGCEAPSKCLCARNKWSMCTTYACIFKWVCNKSRHGGR